MFPDVSALTVHCIWVGLDDDTVHGRPATVTLTFFFWSENPVPVMVS